MRFDTPESQYMAKHFSLDHPTLSRIKSSLEERQLNFMSVSPVEARMLQFFIQAFQIKTVVEIGTLVGYSAVAMGMKLSREGKIYCFEKDMERAAEAQKNLEQSGLECSYEVFSGPAMDRLPLIESQGPFDLVFIDANKNDYCLYLDWAEKHTKKGGLIIGDNTFLFGALWNQSRDLKIGDKQIQTMDEFNARLGDPRRYNSILIPTLEGMTVGQKLF